MKRLLWMFSFLVIGMNVFAQNLDKLTLENDEVIKCTVTMVTEDLIHYKIEDEAGVIEKYSIDFDKVLVLESDNEFIKKKYMDIKADKSVPVRTEIAKGGIFIIGGAAVGVAGLGLWSYAEFNRNALTNNKRGQLSATGITMTAVGAGLVVLGLYQMKEAGEKLFDKKAYYFGPTNEGLGFVYSF
jgi:hypothetical protein